MARQESSIFVGNAELDTAEEPVYRVMWIQVAEQSDNLEPELSGTVLDIPVMINTYYSVSGATCRHNKQHKDDLEIERKLRTKDWWKWWNTSIFGMIIVDSVNVHQACAGPKEIEYDPNEWFTALYHELINNAFKEHRRRSSNTGQPRKVEAAPTLIPGNNRRK